MSNLIKFGVAAALAGVTVVAGAAEPAALLQQPQGKVFVSQGSAMVPAREGMAVVTGSRVISLEGSQVNVTYADGCVLELPANSMLVLGQTRKCTQDLAAIRAVDGFQAERIGQVPQPRPVAAQIPNAVAGASVNGGGGTAAGGTAAGGTAAAGTAAAGTAAAGTAAAGTAAAGTAAAGGLFGLGAAATAGIVGAVAVATVAVAESNKSDNPPSSP